jgi:hypothetical protein
MIRPITSATTSEPLSRAGLVALRPAEGSGERAALVPPARTFITHTARPVQGDPEATLQKLLRIRDDALDPPASVADLAIATAAAIRIGRLVRDRYAAEQVTAAGDQPGAAPTLPPMKA